MEIKDIEIVLNESLEKPEDESLKNKYRDSIADYLKNHKSSDQLVSIVIKGLDIDRGSNYLDYVAGVPKGDIQSIWKQIKDNKELSNNKDNKGLKLLCQLLSLAVLREGSIEIQTGRIISKIVSLVNDEKKPIPSNIYRTIILEYFVEDVIDCKYPNWESLKLKGDTNKSFAEMIIESLPTNQNEKYKSISQWATLGIRNAEKVIEKEQIEAKIPPSHINDIKALENHYGIVEKQLRESVYRIDELEKQLRRLQEEKNVLNEDKKNLQAEIDELKSIIDKQKNDLLKAEEEIIARTSINDAFTALKESDEKGILNDIASELDWCYRQFRESESTEMNAELGEKYRKLIKRVFKILDTKGIRME